MWIETAGKAERSKVLPQTLPVTARLSQRPLYLIKGPHPPYRDASAIMQSFIRCNIPSSGSPQREGRLPRTRSTPVIQNPPPDYKVFSERDSGLWP
jgi:hypothetical protein